MKKLIIICLALFMLSSCSVHYSIEKTKVQGNWKPGGYVWVLKSVPKDEYIRQTKKFMVYENSSNR